MRIAVYGTASGTYSAHAAKVARELGKLIVERGHTLITGACEGIPLEAVRGAVGLEGTIIGFSPASSLEEHQRWGMPTEGITKFTFVPESYEHAHDPMLCRKERNISSVAACDAAIFIAGKVGTLNEFTIAYDLGKPIGVLIGSGGVAGMLEDIVETAQKEPRPFMVFSSDPLEILHEFEKQALHAP